ncbi:hypothetical protein BU24DRAFT_443140 [Aaosphaeria arxii CBS 175.79]|uniref:Ubiquitin-like domain-containing protein n=1 Tax=Aaosphaeria arxii CBS 175.79 TaxID=1450172 RepID=A0A6A5XIN3_9PLEO|nr:uncharacterized protein BU24DRAFT_443140 [Aaosphaeria arxii CBS 175.79]KAF2012813.1 hypothetical protein BU24DRAFT_443140 [Aaosphaeria arxii CBS 175.79]
MADEVTFCRAFLSALDSRPAKLSGDHIADARNYPAQSAFVLPKLPHPPHPARPNAKTAANPSDAEGTSSSASAGTIDVSLKPMKSTFPSVSLPAVTPSQTSIFDLKSAYATQTSIPVAKIKILYKKKPATDSKTVAEVVGQDVGGEVEFSVMLMGGAVPTTPVQSPRAVAPPTEGEKGLSAEVDAAGAGGPAAQGPSGKEVVASEEFWGDLQSFVVQRIRDEGEGQRLVGVFKEAWEKSR